MPSDQARAFWITAPGEGSIQTQAIAPRASDELTVRALYSGISRGTERLIWQGRVPTSQYQRMRAPFQNGEFPAPIQYGYASVGVVEAGPDDWLGQTLFALYPHQDRYNLPIDSAFPLPAGLPAARAILTANAETALNACWDACPRPGEQIRVVGAGVVGSLVASLCHSLPGTDVELIDINPARQAIAEALNLRFASPDQARGDADQVIHTSATEAGLDLALKLAGDDAQVTEISWFGDLAPHVALGEAFHSRRLTLRSSQVGQMNPRMRARWDYRRRLQKALDIVAAHPEWAALIDAESAFEDLPETMAHIAASDGLCHRIRYEED